MCTGRTPCATRWPAGSWRRKVQPWEGEGDGLGLGGLDLDVREGETVGILGRNGSGKSTLLKLLARITEPTTGFAQIHGRVGALLEVGAGFHPN